MPIIEVHLLEGRSLGQKRAFVEAVTEVACSTLQVRREQVRIILSEMPREGYAIGGTLVADRDGTGPARAETP
jgi:4-oxalocrotonate tautomerase